MYTIYADDICIYNDADPSPDLKVNNPELTMGDNAAGSLTMSLPPNNVGYESIQRLITDIVVKKEKNQIWMGRVLTESKDFWNNRVLYCEGELAFFNDSVQPPKKFETTINSIFRELISNHNSQVTDDRRFTVGQVTVTGATSDNHVFYTNYDKTMASINNLIETYGGHIRIRHVNGVRTIDYLDTYPGVSEQRIEFGANLLDFTRSWDMSEYATVIVPLGARINNSKSESDLDEYVTVAEVNNNSIYVTASQEILDTYGRIAKTVEWSDEEDPSSLFTKATLYLGDTQFDEMVLEMSALDLHYLNPDMTPINLLDKVQVVSGPHGLGIDKTFPVVQLKIPLDSPEKATFQLGGSIKTSLTAVNNKINSKILSRIDKIPNSVLTEARRNSTAIINNAGKGHITIRWHDENENDGIEFIDDDSSESDAIYISEAPWSDEDEIGPGDRYWIWNMGGLGYMDKTGGEDSPYWDSTTHQHLYKLAITMDGSIVADFITTGVMTADRIRAGILQDIGHGSTPTDLLSTYGDIVDDTISAGVTYKGKGTYEVSGKATAVSSCQIAIIPAMDEDEQTVNFKAGDTIGVYITNTQQDNSEEIQFVKTVWERIVNDRVVSTRNGLSAADSYTLTVPSQMSVNDSNPPTHLVVQLTVPEDAYSKGTVTVKIMNMSSDSNVIFDLTSGNLTMKHGFIGLGAIRSGETGDESVFNTHYMFEVNDQGRLIAGDGIFAGTLVAASGSFKGTVQAQDFLLPNGTSMLEVTSKTYDANNNILTYKFAEGVLDLPTYTIGVDGATITFTKAGHNADGSNYSTLSEIKLSADNILIQGTTVFLSNLFDEEMRNGQSVTVIDGGYLKTGTVVADRLNADFVYTGTITSGTYWDDDQRTSLTLNTISAAGIASLVYGNSGNGSPPSPVTSVTSPACAFGVNADFIDGGILLYSGGTAFLRATADSNIGHVWAQGTWHFGNAVVTGINATFG